SPISKKSGRQARGRRGTELTCLSRREHSLQSTRFLEAFVTMIRSTATNREKTRFGHLTGRIRMAGILLLVAAGLATVQAQQQTCTPPLTRPDSRYATLGNGGEVED